MKRLLLTLGVACVIAHQGAAAEDAPGVTANEIKIGGTFAFSGPVSSVGNVGKGLLAYVTYLNDNGGVAGRKVNYIALDDAYSPPKAVEQVRKLVESDEVSFIFSQLGTPTNSAVAAYLIAKKVPSVGILSGSNKFDDLEKYPYTTTGLPSFDTEGRVYAKYLRRELPSGKIAILYQNDDLGRDYVNAFRSVYGDDFATRVVTASYEISAPTIDSQVVALKNTGAEALFIAGTSKFAAQAIRTVGEIGWKATLIINFPSGSVSATLVPAGLDKSIGIITATFSKDPSDARWKDDRDITFYRLILEKYLPGADIADTNYLIGVRQGMILEKLIKQCGNDLSRSNIIKQARELKDLVVPTVIPGIKVNTSASNNRFWTQLQLQRWNGSAWQAFGEILDANAQ